METLPKFGISRADMMKRVARFKDLKGSDGGLPDSKAPHCERTLYCSVAFGSGSGPGLSPTTARKTLCVQNQLVAQCGSRGILVCRAEITFLRCVLL